ncbi:MAG: transposase [Deltaproteobacteria bacterium]|nr:transposase [Deltaproteobacteria bacterium]
MRRIHQKQQTLTPIWSAHEHATELEAISEILDANPTIAALAAQDLIDPEKDSGRGAPGMTADQVVRCAIIKQMHEYSYEALAFHIDDSRSYQRFCRIGIGDKPWKRSTLAENIKRLKPSPIERCLRR